MEYKIGANGWFICKTTNPDPGMEEWTQVKCCKPIKHVDLPNCNCDCAAFEICDYPRHEDGKVVFYKKIYLHCCHREIFVCEI